MTIYRELSKCDSYEEKKQTSPSFALAPFGGQQPNCPICTRQAPSPGRVCNGKRSFWRRTLLCPATPHFHPECSGCDHVWLMAPRSSVPTGSNDGT